MLTIGNFLLLKNRQNSTLWTLFCADLGIRTFLCPIFCPFCHYSLPLHHDNADWETLVSEDFSLWTKGTEDEPDSKMYPEDYFTTGNVMLPDSLFHQGNWSGMGLYEAGGNVALAYPNMGGEVSTPLMNMNGKLRVKARVKVIKEKALFFLSFGQGGYMYPSNPIDDLDMADTYQFTVQGVSAKGSKSDVSELKYAYGVAAPHVKPATDINKRGAYTANWEAAPKATSYKLNSYEIYNVPEDADSYTLFEENFNKCTQGTEDHLTSVGNYESMSLDDYTDNAGWTGTGTLLCKGMVGCYTDTYVPFDMVSPVMSLDNNGGEYTVTVDFQIQNAGETLIVQGDNTMYQSVECAETGKHTASVTLQGGTRFSQLMFYTKNNTPFLLDKVTVSQPVKKGDQYFTLLDEREVEGDATSVRVSGLSPRANYSYAYNLISYYDRYGTVYTSDRSDDQEVDFFGVSGIRPVKLALGEQPANVTIYDMQGRQVSKTGKGLYLIKTGDKVQKVILK